MSKNKMSIFFGKIQELLAVEPSEEVAINVMIDAIDERLGSTVGNDAEKVKIIRELIESQFVLTSAQLDFCFTFKDRAVTIPKLIWVIVSINVLNGDRSRVRRIIGNGLTNQKIYSCLKTYEELNDKISYDREIKQHITSIIELYEKTILLREAK